MRITMAVLVSILLSLNSGLAEGGANDEARVALHAAPYQSKMICEDSPLGTGTPCSDYLTEWPLASSANVYLVVARADLAGFRELSVGITYDAVPGSGVDVFGWTLCADLGTSTAGPNGHWPSAGSSAEFQWTTCQQTPYGSDGVHAVAGAVYVYAYGDDLLGTTSHAVEGSIVVSNCALTPTHLPPSVGGAVAFGSGSGVNPCLTAELWSYQPSDGSISDVFSRAVAIEGDRVVAGAPDYGLCGQPSCATSGAGYVLNVSSGSLVNKVLPVAGPLEPSDLGQSVDIHNGLIALGSPGQGSVYLVDASSGSLIREVDTGLTAGGEWVGLTGSRLVVPDPLSPRVRVFALSTDTMTLEYTPSQSDSNDDITSVAADGHLAVVGLPLEGANGAAYLFDILTGQELYRFTPSLPGGFDRFGESVAIDGDLVVVGARFGTGVEPDAGAAYVYSASTGAELHRLTAPDGESLDRFGEAVAVSGSTVLVGAPHDDDVTTDAGAAYFFDVATGSFLSKVTASNGGVGFAFGEGVALDGNRAAIGSYGNYTVYLFAAPNEAPTPLAASPPEPTPRAVARPNPFATTTVLELSPATPGSEISVFDVRGRLVRRLRSRQGVAQWDGKDEVGAAAPPGMYFARVQRGDQTQVTKLVKLRP